MKLLTKRSVAYLIDIVLFAVFFYFAFHAIIMHLPHFVIFLLVFPLLCRDIVFRNASIGKLMMSISIYDKNWKKPSIWKLITRSFLTQTIGYARYCKYKFKYGSKMAKMAIIDWERDKLGTFVIDNRVYTELSSEAKEMKGDFAANMTELYNRYLRGQYLPY